MDKSMVEMLESKARYIVVIRGRIQVEYEDGNIACVTKLDVYRGRLLLNGSFVRINHIDTLESGDTAFLRYLDGDKRILWQEECKSEPLIPAVEVRGDVVIDSDGIHYRGESEDDFKPIDFSVKEDKK